MKYFNASVTILVAAGLLQACGGGSTSGETVISRKLTVTDGMIARIDGQAAEIQEIWRDTDDAQVVSGTSTFFFYGAIAGDDQVYAAYTTEAASTSDYRRRYAVGRFREYVPQTGTATLTGAYVATVEEQLIGATEYFFGWQVVADMEMSVDFENGTIGGSVTNSERFADRATTSFPWVNHTLLPTEIEANGTFTTTVSSEMADPTSSLTVSTSTNEVQGILGGTDSTHAAGWIDTKFGFTPDRAYRERGAFVASTD